MLVNVYCEPRDCVRAHNDKDVTQHERTQVVCLNQGGTRTMRFTANEKVPGAENFVERTDIEVGDGKVYVMLGEYFQDYILHACLPASKKDVLETRVSMTFRRFLKHNEKQAPGPPPKETPSERMSKKARTESPLD
jgi:hypothetical protein